MEFSTSDRDNDPWGGVYFNCAAIHHGGGGNWWNDCGHNNINGKYDSNGDIGDEFMWWIDFDNSKMSLKTMTLMFRQVD